MNSSMTIERVAGIGNLILPWRKLQRRCLQQGCIFVRYVTNHSRERIISHSTCLSMARNVSNAVIVQNVTVDERNWKSTYFVTTQTKNRTFPTNLSVVEFAPRCLGGHSTLDVTLLCARKNPLKLSSLIWKPWCLKWLLLRGSIDRSWKWGRQFQHFCMQMSTCQRSLWWTNTRKLWSCIDSHKFSMCQYMNMPHWSHGKRKYWHSFNNLPIGKLFGSLVNREGKARLSSKTISSITTVIDVWLPLTLLLVPNTLSITCQNFPWSVRTSFCSLKEDRWCIYEIKGEELCAKTPTKTLQMLITAHKNYTIYVDWRVHNIIQMQISIIYEDGVEIDHQRQHVETFSKHWNGYEADLHLATIMWFCTSLHALIKIWFCWSS